MSEQKPHIVVDSDIHFTVKQAKHDGTGVRKIILAGFKALGIKLLKPNDTTKEKTAKS